MDDKLAKKIGLSVSRNSENFNFGFDYEFSEQEGLKNKQIYLSIRKKLRKI